MDRKTSDVCAKKVTRKRLPQKAMCQIHQIALRCATSTVSMEVNATGSLVSVTLITIRCYSINIIIL